MKKKVGDWTCQYLVGDQLINFDRLTRNESFSNHTNYYVNRALSSRLGPLPGLSVEKAREQYATVKESSGMALRLIITIAVQDYTTDDEEVATVVNATYGSPSEHRMLQIRDQTEARKRAGCGGNVQALLDIKRAARAKRNPDDSI